MYIDQIKRTRIGTLFENNLSLSSKKETELSRGTYLHYDSFVHPQTCGFTKMVANFNALILQ